MSDTKSEHENQKLVWVTIENMTVDEGERVVQDIEQALPDYNVIVSTDAIELIDATEMKQTLETMIDDD